MKKIIGCVLLMCFFSCSVTKDRKAVARVTYNTALFNQIGRQWQVANPCSIDTVRQFINGKEVVRYDTLFADRIDTVFNPVTQIQTVYKTVTKYINKTDTLITYVTDNRALNLVTNDLSNAQGQITQLQTDLKESKADNQKKVWWLIRVSVFSFLVIGGLTFLLFKK